MDLQIETPDAKIQKIFNLASELAPNDQRVLIDLLSRQIGDGLPEKTTADEAISLYLRDKCSLARAAELASLSRWELIDVLKSRGIPVTIEAEFTASEMDGIENDLEREGLLCS